MLLLAVGFGLRRDRHPAVRDTRQAPKSDLVAGVLIGLAFWPLRSVATRIADRLVFGGRASPYEVLTTFSGRVGEAYAADDVLPTHGPGPGDGDRRGPRDGVAPGRRGASACRALAGWSGRTAGGALDGNRIPPLGGDHAVEIRDHDELLGALSVTMPPRTR